MLKTSTLFTVLIAVAISPLSIAMREKRSLPLNEHCDPDVQVCRKGDLIRRDIADCRYTGGFFFIGTCSAVGDTLSWTVDVAEGDRCQPLSGRRFACGAAGSNTRCVCSDTNIFYNPGPNECRCQYWPEHDVGHNSPAFCTGYYSGGSSGVHHWACCDNCNDNPRASRSCRSQTWQGGSTGNYCGDCGQNNGAGRSKYFFNCGSCYDQEQCSQSCSQFAGDLPGLCWQWLDCFKDCCMDTDQPQK